MPKYTEKIKKQLLPLVPLDGVVIFPAIPISVELTSKQAVKACEKASSNDGEAFFVLRKFDDSRAAVSAASSDILIPEKDVYTIGCTAFIKQIVKFREDNARVVVEGISRAEIVSLITDDEKIPMATVLNKSVKLESDGDPEVEAQIFALRKFPYAVYLDFAVF